jgi:hypothetical protein
MVNHVCVCSASAIVVTCVREPEGVSAIRDPTPLPPSSVHSPSRRGGRAPCPRPVAEATGRHVPRTAGQQPASLHRCQAADSRGAICGDRAPSPHAACATAPRRLARPTAVSPQPAAVSPQTACGRAPSPLHSCHSTGDGGRCCVLHSRAGPTYLNGARVCAAPSGRRPRAHAWATISPPSTGPHVLLPVAILP